MKAFFSWWGAKAKSSRSALIHDSDSSRRGEGPERKSTLQSTSTDLRPESPRSSQEKASQPNTSCEHEDERPHGRLRGKGPITASRPRHISNIVNKSPKLVEAIARPPPPNDSKTCGDQIKKSPIQGDDQRPHDEDIGPMKAPENSNSLLAPKSLQSGQFDTPVGVLSNHPIQPFAEVDDVQITEVLQGPPTQALPSSYTEEIFDLSGSVSKLDPLPVFDGTYSTVFMGKWKDTKVAIKQIRGVGSLATTRRKVKREREIWGRLSHPNILPLYGFSDDFGNYGALISPWCENGNVGNYIRRFQVGPLQRFQLWCGITNGIVYLHSHNPVVIHGDLKPSNVLIDDEGNARLCDFGLVRILSEGRTGLTTTTQHTGTIRYLAHELVDSDESILPTTASDVYALGCVALEVIFLRSPYANHRNTGHIYKDIFRNIPPATHFPGTSEPPASIKALWDLLTTCWNVDPAARPSAYEVSEFIKNHGSSVVAAFAEGFIPAPVLLV